jgi:hypothetical protein
MVETVTYPKPNLNSAEFICRKAVPIFATYKDDDGSNYNKAYLEDVVKNCRKREETGDYMVVTLGHTNPSKDEVSQPPVVGYATDARLAKDKRGRTLIVADLYIEQKHYAEAMTYSRRSVELWVADRYIDVVSLLKQSPKLDLGLLTAKKIGNSNFCVFKKTTDTYLHNGGIDVDKDELKTLVKELIAEHFAKDDDLEEECHTPKTHAESDEDDEDEDEDGKKKEKKKKCHEGAAVGVPGGDNSFMPGGSEEEKKKDHARMKEEQEAIELNRANTELAALKSEYETLRRDYRKQIRERDLVQLQAEGFIFDRSEELDHVLELDDTTYSKHMSRARKLYQRSPYSKERIPVVEDAPGIESTRLTPAKRDEIVKYALNNHVDFGRAMKEIK